MKRKYIHIEIRDDRLYVYSDGSSHGGKTLTLNEMDNECCIIDNIDGYTSICDNKYKLNNFHFKIPLKDFVKL